MKKISAIIVACSLGLIAQAQLIDDFSGDLSAYTATRILNNGSHNPVNTYQWEISGGSLQLNTSSYTGIEQYALTRSDYSLNVGYELTATFAAGYTGTQDIGLYIGAATPTTDVRANYLNIYERNNGQLFSRGFDGTTEVALAGGATVTPDSLFIARTGASTFELGYYIGSTRTIVSSRTIASSSSLGAVIGFYADVRSAGIVGTLDNLTITAVPEPSTLAICGMSFIGLLAVVRRKK